jgi:hypothetical protein
MDIVDIISWSFIAISLGIFYWIGKVTSKLIKQHYNIYPLLYELDEAEKEKR